MYAALINYPVKHGELDEAVQAWREGEKEYARGLQGYEGSVLLVKPDRLVVVAFWETKPEDDAFATTGPWREGSGFRNKIDPLLSEEPTREEFKVGFANVGGIS
jgi:heme-degrading monooxygenase HmoA